MAESAEGAGEKPKVRGRGTCKFRSAFGGSGLLSWTNDDPESAPSREALNPWERRKQARERREAEEGGDKSREADDKNREGHGKGKCDESEKEKPGLVARLRARSEEGGRYLKRRKTSPEGDPKRRRRRSVSKKKQPEPNKPRTQWVRVINVPSVVQSKHLQHLFKTSLGGVKSCTVEDGIASVCFETPEIAEKAIVKYNNGEINGCTISVQLDFSPKQSSKEHTAGRR